MNEQVRVSRTSTAQIVSGWESLGPAGLVKNLFEQYYDYFYISGSRRPAGSSGRSTASARSPERTRIREMLKDCLNAVDALPSVRNRLRLCVVAELQVVRRQVYLRAKDAKLGADLNAIQVFVTRFDARNIGSQQEAREIGTSDAIQAMLGQCR